MKKPVIIFLAVLLTQQVIQAQGTVYLSNLDQPSAGSLAVGSDSWYAPMFITGPNTGGYSLDLVQLEMAGASGDPSVFTAMIYSETGIFGSFPGTNLCNLNGSTDPLTAGINTYMPASSLVLSPNTMYFIVLTGGTTIASGAYEWSYQNTGSYNPIDNWHTAVPLWSNNGSSWHSTGPPFYSLQYAITATAIPEPSMSWLFLLGSAMLFYLRRIINR